MTSWALLPSGIQEEMTAEDVTECLAVVHPYIRMTWTIVPHALHPPPQC